MKCCKQTSMQEIEKLIEIVKQLRASDGCPWDSVQTHESLKKCMVEETAEVLASIDVLRATEDSSNFCEELGDLLFLIVLQCEIAQGENLFSFSDVVNVVSEKMIHRHPRIFASGKEEEELDWNELKKQEKQLVPERIEQEKKTALSKAKQDMVQLLCE